MTHAKLAATSICVFDAYGTLFDVGGAARRWRDLLGEKTAVLSDLWRRKQLEYSWLRGLMGKYEDFWHVTGSALDHAFTVLGLRDPVLRSKLMTSYFELDAYPDAKSVLARLKDAGRMTAILSNGAPSMLSAAVTSAGIHKLLDAVLSVDAVGTYKPHPSVYALVGQRFGCAPDAVCFVSANGWDVAGAGSFGFQPVWINRADQPVEELPGRPTATIASLDDLPGLLGL